MEDKSKWLLKSDSEEWAQRRLLFTASSLQIPDLHRDGRFIEEVGYYNPMTNPAEIKVDAEKAQKWLENGAQPTETVKSILTKSGIIK